MVMSDKLGAGRRCSVQAVVLIHVLEGRQLDPDLRDSVVIQNVRASEADKAEGGAIGIVTWPAMHVHQAS